MANTPRSIKLDVVPDLAGVVMALRLGPLLGKIALQILDPQEPTDHESRKVAQAADAVRDLLEVDA